MADVQILNLNLRRMPGNRLDLGTAFGIGGAFALIAWALFDGGNIRGFLNLPSFVIVGGGTVCATIAGASLR